MVGDPCCHFKPILKNNLSITTFKIVVYRTGG